MSNTPHQDTLFLAAPGFVVEGQGPFYCGDCIALEGLLSLYPQIHQGLEVRHIAFRRPRQEVVALLGEQHQSLPVLVMAAASSPGDIGVRVHGGQRFIDDEAAIRRYLSQRAGVARQH